MTRDELSQLIPHAGTMCLLDTVEYWDETSIVCLSQSHLRDDNPLLKSGHLSIVHGIEYGAQAMAVHGGLLAGDVSQSSQPAYLASLKKIQFHEQRFLSDRKGQNLVVEAERVYASEGSLVYSFRVLCEDTLLLSGEAMVIPAGDSE